MPGRGPAPKDPAKRQRRNAQMPMVQLEAPTLPGPELADGGFLQQTFDWYAIWRESFQASQFTSTDWQRLHMLAPLIDQYFRAPDKALLGEIRLNEERLGATALDRQRLRWEVPGDGDQPAKKRPSPRRRTDPRLKLVSNS